VGFGSRPGVSTLRGCRGRVKLSLCLIKQNASKTCAGVDVWLHLFLTSALAGVELSVSRPDHFTLRGKFLRFRLDETLGGPKTHWKKKYHPRASNRTRFPGRGYRGRNMTSVCPLGGEFEDDLTLN
jgi:hypothetical protein